jgi:hypothetical protein
MLKKLVSWDWRRDFNLLMKEKAGALFYKLSKRQCAGMEKL